MTTLPSFRINLNDGTSYVTSMSTNTTLQMAKEYFLGQVQTDEAADGTETRRTVTCVEVA